MLNSSCDQRNDSKKKEEKLRMTKLRQGQDETKKGSKSVSSMTNLQDHLQRDKTAEEKLNKMSTMINLNRLFIHHKS